MALDLLPRTYRHFSVLMRLDQRRIVVFTGPVFSERDTVYRGVGIPLRFFKVAAFIHDGGLAATGYVLDQTPQLANLPDAHCSGADAHGSEPRYLAHRNHVAGTIRT
ncbi:hypothetical protein ACLH0K_08145 [Arthrobacter sp. MPF02]|uniref:hypothetical protein n=1 Tax=Arthrobacter sp. MPF02 TaxID=3388492 RepID=UPI0039849157